MFDLNHAQFGATEYARKNGGAILFAMAVFVVIAIISMKFFSV